MTLTDWAREFQAVENVDNVLASGEEIKKEVTLLADESERFKTPGKKRKEVCMEEVRGALDWLNMKAYMRSLPGDSSTTELDAFIEVIESSKAKGVLTKIVGKLESGLVTQGDAIREVAMLTHDRFRENENGLGFLAGGAVQQVQASIGDPIELDSKFNCPTLWSLVSFIAHEVLCVGGGLALMEDKVNPIKDSLDATKIECQRLAGLCLEPNKKTTRLAVVLSGNVREAEEEICSIKTRVNTLESEDNLIGIKSRVHTLEAAWTKDMEQRKRRKVLKVAPSEGKDKSVEDLLSGGWMKKKAVLKDDHKEKTGSRIVSISSSSYKAGEESNEECFLSKAMASVLGVLTTLRSDVKLLKLGSEDKAVKFCRLGFRSLQDCNAWIKENFSSHQYGLIMDPLLMLDRIFRTDALEVADHFKNSKSRVKLKIPTGQGAKL